MERAERVEAALLADPRGLLAQPVERAERAEREGLAEPVERAERAAMAQRL